MASSTAAIRLRNGGSCIRRHPEIGRAAARARRLATLGKDRSGAGTIGCDRWAFALQPHRQAHSAWWRRPFRRLHVQDSSKYPEVDHLSLAELARRNDGVVAQVGIEQGVGALELRRAEGVTAVDDDVAVRVGRGSGAIRAGAWSAAPYVWPPSRNSRRGTTPAAAIQTSSAIEAVRAGVAEEDQVVVAAMSSAVTSMSSLMRSRPREVLVPLGGEPFQPGIGPLLESAVPGVAGAPDAQERAGEGVVDRPLQAGCFLAEVVLLEPARLLVVQQVPARSPLAGSRPSAAGRRPPVRSGKT